MDKTRAETMQAAAAAGDVDGVRWWADYAGHCAGAADALAGSARCLFELSVGLEDGR